MKHHRIEDLKRTTLSKTSRRTPRPPRFDPVAYAAALEVLG